MKSKLLPIAIALLVVSAIAANYPLEIIQPQEGLDTKNRFYKAYPGIEYKVNVAAIGGAWPFVHTLVKAPAGMTIDQDKGIITWPSPTTAGSPHSVSVSITDQEGSIDAHTWTITVTTDKFLFVDAINGKTRGEGGTGTIDNPFKGIAGWYSINTQPEEYNAKYETSYPEYFIYYKSGVYVIPDWENHGYLPQYQDKKPKVHMALPGEKPVFDCSISRFGGGYGNNYWEGFEFKNIVNEARKALGGGAGKNNTIVRNVFHGLSYKSGSFNQSAIMYSKTNEDLKSHIAIMDNEFYDMDHGYCVLVYSTNKSVYERNWAHSIRPTGEAHHCIGLKHNASQWFIRNNRFTDLGGNTDAIWLYFEANTDVNYEQVEVSHNLVQHTERSAGTCLVLGNGSSDYGEVWVQRNTFVGSRILIGINTASDGPVSISNNVIVNEYYMHDQHVTINPAEDAGRVLLTDNVSGKPSDNVVDANGMLTAAYSQYVGTHGHYVDGVTALAKPVAQQIRITRTAGLAQAYDILGRRIPTAMRGRNIASGTRIVFVKSQNVESRAGISYRR